jgi:hypothetical protein
MFFLLCSLKTESLPQCGQDGPWISVEFRELFLGTALPGSMILLAIIQDCLKALRFPKLLQDLFRHIFSPFHNFITLEDVMDPAKSGFRHSPTKTRILSGLAFFASATWLGCFVYDVLLDNTMYAVRSFVASITWVRFWPVSCPVHGLTDARLTGLRCLYHNYQATVDTSIYKHSLCLFSYLGVDS